MSRVRLKISSDSIAETTLSNFAWDGTFVRKLERDRVYHLHELKGDIILLGSDYTLVNDLANECEVVTITVERYCDGDWVLYWTGLFTKFDCKINPVQCKLSVKPKTSDKYKCIYDAWDEDVNIYFDTGDTIVVKEFYGTYVNAINGCFECRTAATGLPVCTETEACEELTTETYNTELCDNPSFPIYAITWFHRINGTGTPTTPPPYDSGWTHLSGSTWWRCPTADDLRVGVLKYGRRFDAVLTKFINQIDCGLTVRSHFFGINATHAAPPDNDAYDYAVLNYQDMTIHQKSEVKRPDASDASFSYVWKFKLKTFLEDLRTMFNVYWKLDGNDLILEHISYFEAVAGADYSTRTIPREIEYEFDAPKQEKFTWSDEDCSDPFKGLPILYNCGSEKRENKVTLFSTDVVFIRDETNQDKILDDNWVLMSNTIDSGTYFNNDHNSPLSWTNLHDKLHRHNRPFIAGNLNGVDVTFETSQPIRKADEFTVPYCCDDEADPSKYVTTSIGQGRVQTQTENILKDTLKLQLNYE